jgi:sec-independent protein translocase protein TatB
MFDIGFSEMLLIAIVALVVIGPERLPKVARTAGHLLGRLQRYVSNVKSDINREMQLEELRKLQSEMQESARSVEQSLTSEMHAARQAITRRQRLVRRRAPDPGGACRASPSAAGRAGAIPLQPAAASDGRSQTGWSRLMLAMNPPEDSFLSHLVELRNRLIRALLAIGVVFICLFPWAKELYALLAQPLLARCRKGGR